jgi:DNA mismatch endonuclease (patch repair protein)
MQGNRRHDTQPEIALRSLLHKQGFRFRKHARPVAELNCEADIVFPRQQVAVFVDGCFWHGCEAHGKAVRSNSGYWEAKIAANVARDRRNDAALAGAGWAVVRVWEHESPSQAAAQVVAALDTPQGPGA